MKAMNHPVVTFVVLVLVGVGGGYAWWTADATVVRLPDADFYPAEVRETAAEAQMTLAPFSTISLHEKALIQERIDVALDPSRAVLGSATSEISDIASQFIVARFGSSTDEYLTLRLSAGWTPKSDAEIEIGGCEKTLEYVGLNTTGVGGDIATARAVLNGMAAAPGGLNRYVGILDGVEVFAADITPANSRMGVIEGTLGSLVWQGSVSQTGRSWLKPPTDPDMSGDSVRIGFILESESGWRSPFQMVLKRTLGNSGWVLISVDRFNTTQGYASIEW